MNDDKPPTTKVGSLAKLSPLRKTERPANGSLCSRLILWLFVLVMAGLTISIYIYLYKLIFT